MAQSASAGSGPSASPLLRRLEDPAAAAAVPAPRWPPVHMASQSRARSSGPFTSHRGVQLALRFRRLRSLRPSKAHLPTSAPFRAGHQARYPASYAGAARGGAGHAAPVSCCLSATGIRFLGILCPPGNSASLTVGLPAAYPRRTPTGFPRSARARRGRAGRPLYPGDGGALAGRRYVRGRRLPPPSGQSLHPGRASHLREYR